MVPFFSRRSILILLIGFVVGSLLGLGYWLASPIETEMAWPPIHFNGDDDSEIYQSAVTIELETWAQDTTETQRRREGLYHAAVIASTSFLDFLSTSEQASLYPRSPDQLAEMLVVRYNYEESHIPSFDVRISSSSEQEAYYLASVVLHTYKDYLEQLEYNAWLNEYDDMLEATESVIADLVEIRNELANIAAQAGVDLSDPKPGALQTLQLIPEYVIAEAKVRALERQLDFLVRDLTSLSNGDHEPEAVSLFVGKGPSVPICLEEDKVRGRNALMMGAVLGVALAWVGLNHRGIFGRLHPATAATVRREEEDEEEE